MVEMKHVLEKCVLILGKKQLPIVVELITLKLMSDQFEKERIEIRNDFLVRGICAKEVDGLIEEPSYYKMFIPKHARWNHLKYEKEQLVHCIQKALTDLTPSIDHKWDIDHYTIANLINVLDLYQFSKKNSSEKEIEQLKDWMEENKIDSKETVLLSTYSEFLK